MNTKTIYTNGACLFTMENYSKAAGACHVNGITIHGQWDAHKVRAAHANGSLHRVYGIGDSRHLTGLAMRRGMNIDGFEVR